MNVTPNYGSKCISVIALSSILFEVLLRGCISLRECYNSMRGWVGLGWVGLGWVGFGQGLAWYGMDKPPLSKLSGGFDSLMNIKISQSSRYLLDFAEPLK